MDNADDLEDLLTKQWRPSDVAAYIGASRYAAAGRRARVIASRFDDPRAPRDSDFEDEEMVPHHIGQSIMYAPAIAMPDRVALLFSIFHDIPSYGLLMYLHAIDNDQTALTRLWAEVRIVFDGDDEAQIAALGYYLGVDLFSYADDSPHPWARLTDELTAERVLRRVLECAGPVGIRTKLPVYRRILGRYGWARDAIRRDIKAVDHSYWGPLVDDQRDAARELAALLNEHEQGTGSPP